MGKRINILMPLVVLSMALYARVYEGVVIDELGGSLEYVTVAAFNDTTVVASVLTNGKGQFRLDSIDPVNSLRFSLMGYQTLVAKQSDYPVDGIFVLKSEAKDLGEVTVTAKPVTFEADRFILNLNADPFAKGKDMSQILQNAPGVIMDRRTLSILGSTGVQVYINDRRVKMSGERLYQYLQSIQSSAVNTVEIIPSAGAEYSASFEGGVIKINLKKIKDDGYNGNVSVSATRGERRLAFNPSFNFGYHTGKTTWNMIASVPVTPYMKHTNTEYSDNVNSGIHIESENRSRNHSVTPGILISGVVDFDKRNSLGVEAEYKFGDKHDRTSSGSILFDKDAEIPTRGFYNRRERNHDIDTRMNYTRYIDSKNSYLKFIGGFSYRDYTTDEDNEVVKEIGDSVYNVAMSSDVTNANLEVRLFKKFSNSWSLSAGVKHTYNHIYNGAYHTYDKQDEWIADTRYDYDADYDENITALYVSVPGKIWNFSLRAGLRGELYKTSSVGLNRSDFGLFPSLSVTYPLTKKGDYNVNAVYSRKTKRPTFWQQSPLVRQFSDYIYTVGNMDLVSSTTNSITLNFILARDFTVGAGYTFIDNPIRQSFATNPEFPERLYLTYANLGAERNVRVFATGRFSILKGWTLGGTLVYNNQNQRNSDKEKFKSYNIFQGMVYSFVSLPASFNLSLTGLYYSPMQIGNIHVSPTANLSLTLNRSLGKGWNASISADNLLQLKSVIITEEEGFYRKSRAKNYATCSLTISYAFSSGKKFKQRKIENNLDSERLQKE